MYIIRLILVSMALYALALSAFADQVQILGLMKDKVVIQINGETKVINVGETVAGVKAVSADSRQCVLEINGASAVYTLGNDISTHFTKADLPIVRIEKDSRGLYRTGGTINGQPVNFIVDTGATVVAINANQAKTLGIEFGGKVTQVETASGKSKAYPVTLQQITLGDIHVYNVPAVIVQGNSPPEILLGMSFLNRLEMHDHDQLLELRQKY